ncbi:hypothetical protein EYF80_024931 [Liparis tanakae]|uniref:Uncharacterized protein n=1 Tax=Liparis tanakae TaxID=230148 RepID=A0A4Z2HH45_9TELE|nr:hypothetical protein EYF80_024931 [Liparis tanakae]
MYTYHRSRVSGRQCSSSPSQQTDKEYGARVYLCFYCTHRHSPESSPARRVSRVYPKRTAVLLAPRTGHVARAGSPTVAKKVPLRLSALIAVGSAERSGTD